jgi:hypothetical protein
VAMPAPAVSSTAAVRAAVRRSGAGLVCRAGPAGFTLAMAGYFGAAFVLEPFGGRGGELAIGVITWLVLIAAVRPLAARERGRIAAVVLIASAGEILGSLILGLYAYRRGGIPAFVPPGHGLVYLAGYRLSQSGVVRRHARSSRGRLRRAGEGERTSVTFVPRIARFTSSGHERLLWCAFRAPLCAAGRVGARHRGSHVSRAETTRLRPGNSSPSGVS